MSHSWLRRQKKQELLDLSNEAGLPQSEELRKDEIVEKLDAHLQNNATSLSRIPAFEEYYGKRRSTPGRPPRESIVPVAPHDDDDDYEIKSVVKSKVRRQTKVKTEPEEGDFLSSPILASASSSARNAIATVSSALSPSAQLTTARTPAPRRRRSELPGPPSPADVADIVEEQSTKAVSALRTLYTNAGIGEWIEYTRDQCSSVSAVQLTFLFIEAFALQKRLMPWNFAFDIPATVLTPSWPVFLPDLFVLATGYYWSATILWLFTCLAIPAVLAYFYNLTLRDVRRGQTQVTVARYTIDPLSFNVVKALATWLVYVRFVSFGIIDEEVAMRVDSGMFGGSTGVLVGCGVGALATLYEAAQKKHV